ncbi:MAG TPA: hypothetical protein VH328_02790 [Burkholderiaceae bacterium]|nr:hypothetical protein [Burkholderiaceae bacterium]
MTKPLLAVLLSAFAVASFAAGSASAPAPAPAASSAHKHMTHHKAAPATNPMASDAKTGGK